MATSSAINNEPASAASAAKVDMKFEVVVIPVTDVGRSKAFYTKLGWRTPQVWRDVCEYRMHPERYLCHLERKHPPASFDDER